MVSTVLRSVQDARPLPASELLAEIGGDDLVSFTREIDRLRNTHAAIELLALGDEYARDGRTAFALIAFAAAQNVGNADARQRCLTLGEQIEGAYFDGAYATTYFGRVAPVVVAIECYLQADAPARVAALSARLASRPERGSASTHEGRSTSHQ